MCIMYQRNKNQKDIEEAYFNISDPKFHDKDYNFQKVTGTF